MRNTKVLNVGEILQKKFLKKCNKKEANQYTEQQVITKIMKKSIGTIYTLRTKESCMFCLKRFNNLVQQ